MKQEYSLVLIIGLFLFSYVLEAITQPLSLSLPTPYHYITPENLSTYPFTTTVIVIRALSLFLSPLWLMSFIEKKYPLKAGVSLVLAALTQLYVLQELATGQQILPLEWSLSISLAGLVLILMIPVYFIRGLLAKAHESLTKDTREEMTKETDQKEDIPG